MERFAEREEPGTRTHVALVQHPLHPMLVNFPVAFLTTVVLSDLAYIFLGDPFWAGMSFWLLTGGTVMGVIAGVTGTIELLAVGRIRRRTASWSHFVAAVMLLSVAATNCGWRIDQPEAAITPWGLILSVMGLTLVGVAAWLGGELVFAHHVGIHPHEEEG